jgi:hypothetical protein
MQGASSQNAYPKARRDVHEARGVPQGQHGVSPLVQCVAFGFRCQHRCAMLHDGSKDAQSMHGLAPGGPVGSQQLDPPALQLQARKTVQLESGTNAAFPRTHRPLQRGAVGVFARDAAPDSLQCRGFLRCAPLPPRVTAKSLGLQLYECVSGLIGTMQSRQSRPPAV